MKNHIALIFSLCFMGLLLSDCKKSDNEDPDGGNGGTNSTGLTIDGKNVEMKTVIYTYGGEFNGFHNHFLAFYSFDPSNIPGFSKSANFSDYGTLFNISIQTLYEDLKDGTYDMDESDETSPYVQTGMFTPGKDQFENSNIKGEIYYTTDIQVSIASSDDTKTINITGKLVPSSDFFSNNLSNSISFQLNYKGALTMYNYDNY